MPGQIFKKIVIVGNRQIGKSSLVSRYIDDDYSPHLIQKTLGSQFQVKYLNASDNESFAPRIHIFDISETHAVHQQNINNADIIVVAFDLTNMDSLSRSHTWFTSYNLAAHSHKIILAGTKSDALVPDLPRRQKAIADFVQQSEWQCFETSAKDGTGITELFSIIEQRLLNNTVHQDNFPVISDAFKAGFTHREEKTSSAVWKADILSSLESYKEEREKRSKKEYISFFGGSVARFFGGFPKQEKFAAVNALIAAIENDQTRTVSHEHLGPLSQGRLGQLLKRKQVSLHRYIDDKHHPDPSI